MFDYYGLDINLRWGACSNPREAEVYLRLPEHLAKVPKKGRVLDIGAGIGHSLSAAIFIARPDIIVDALDPGYVKSPNHGQEVETRDLVVEYFEAVDQEKLKSTDAWHKSRIVGHAYEIPAEDDFYDMSVSYAAVPAYSYEPEEDLVETIRVLKVGATALNGPMHGETAEEWMELLEDQVKLGKISQFESHEQIIEIEEGSFEVTRFTTLTK